MRKLGKVQQDVLASLKRHGSWSRGCGWLWDTPSNTQRVMDSLVHAGYAAVTADQRRYTPTVPTVEPKRVMRVAVILSDGRAVDGDDVPGMLKRQHAILLQLSKSLAEYGYAGNSAEQKAIGDANMLGLEVADRLKEAKEAKEAEES